MGAGLNIGGDVNHDLDLETALTTLTGEAGNSIGLNELDDVEVELLNATVGFIFMTAGGNIHLVGNVNAGENISLDADLEIYMESGNLLTAVNLDATASSGIFLLTQIDALDARIDGAGILDIRETDAIILNDVSNEDGPVRVISGGQITALYTTIFYRSL